MDKELSGPELRKLVKELMFKKLNIIKEDDDDNLGIYGGGFDELEFDTDAMNAAMADIKASGQNFEPLGKNKFEKNLDIDAMKSDLSRANLDLPSDKENLKNTQNSLDKRYKHEKRFGAGSINETGEWSDDEEGTSWKESLKGELEMVSNMLTPGLPFVIKDIEGFDKYQGPYAIIEIDGHPFKVWTLEDNELWVENFPIDNTSGEGQKPGFAGNAQEVADAFNQQYSILTHMNENTNKIKKTGGLTATDPIFHPLQELQLNPTYTPWGTIDVDIDGLHGMTTISFHRITMKAGGEKTNLYGANLVFENMFDGPPDVEKNAFIGNLIDAIKFVKEEKEKSEKELASIPVIHATPEEPHVGPRVVGKIDLPQDNKKRFKEDVNEGEGDFDEKDIADKHFDMKSLYHYFNDALHQLKWYEPEVAAQVLEATFKRDFKYLSKFLSEGIMNPNVNPNSKIDRPKDAEGQPITRKARVEDIDTGTVGHVIRFGVDDNNNQTVHVDWMYSFGDAIVKPVTYPNKIVVRDENRIVREDEIEEGMGHSHTVGRGQNIKPGNYPQTLKRVGLKENLDQATPSTDAELFLVIDNAFNRAHYKDLIGKALEHAPGYAQVKVVKPEDVEKERLINHDEAPVAEDFDYAADEREHHGREEMGALANEAHKYVPEEIRTFLVPDSFHISNQDEDGRFEMSYILKVPKQSDETVKDIEKFIREYVPTDIGGPGQSYQKTSLYTELEKGTNNWIVNVNVSRGYDI